MVSTGLFTECRWLGWLLGEGRCELRDIGTYVGWLSGGRVDCVFESAAEAAEAGAEAVQHCGADSGQHTSLLVI